LKPYLQTEQHKKLGTFYLLYLDTLTLHRKSYAENIANSVAARATGHLGEQLSPSRVTSLLETFPELLASEGHLNQKLIINKAKKLKANFFHAPNREVGKRCAVGKNYMAR
jgi:hypothetical protein